jgi:hypothetical protein
MVSYHRPVTHPIRVSAAICTRPKTGNRRGLPSYRSYDFIVARQSLPRWRACPPSPQLRLHVVAAEVMVSYHRPAPPHPHPRLGSNLYPTQNRYQTRTAELRPRNYDFIVARQSLPSRRACPPSPKLRLHVVVSEVMAWLAPTRDPPNPRLGSNLYPFQNR